MAGFTAEQMEQFKQIAKLFTKAQAAAPTPLAAAPVSTTDYFKQQALRPEVAGLFWPDYDPRTQAYQNFSNFESLITNKDGTFYLDCFAWFDAWPRMSDAAGGNDKLASILKVYLRGSAKFWWSFTLSEEEHAAMRKDLAEFKAKVTLRFAPKASTALAQLANLTFSMHDVMAGRSVAVWFHQRFRCAKEAGVTSVSDLLQDCWAGLDASLRCNVVAPAPDETTDSFVARLEQMEVTWTDSWRNRQASMVRTPYPTPYPYKRGQLVTLISITPSVPLSVATLVKRGVMDSKLFASPLISLKTHPIIPIFIPTTPTLASTNHLAIKTPGMTRLPSRAITATQATGMSRRLTLVTLHTMISPQILMMAHTLRLTSILTLLSNLPVSIPLTFPQLILTSSSLTFLHQCLCRRLDRSLLQLRGIRWICLIIFYLRSQLYLWRRIVILAPA